MHNVFKRYAGIKKTKTNKQINVKKIKAYFIGKSTTAGKNYRPRGVIAIVIKYGANISQVRNLHLYCVKLFQPT